MALSDQQVVDEEPAAVMTTHATQRMQQRAISHVALDDALTAQDSLTIFGVCGLLDRASRGARS